MSRYHRTYEPSSRGPRRWSARGRAAGAAVGLVALATLLAGAAATRTFLYDDFDDDPIGAVPANMPGSVFLQSFVGDLSGVVQDPGSTIEVVPGLGGLTGHAIRLSDAGVPEGAGGCQLVGIPAIPAGPGVVNVSFLLRAGKFYGDSFEMAVIDNRATPGTGRLAELRIEDDGTLVLGKTPTGTKIKPGAAYRFFIKLQLSVAGPDAWTLRLNEVLDPTSSQTFGPMSSVADGSGVTSLLFATADVGTGSYDLDEIQIYVD